MTLKLIPGGTFLMGSPEDEPDSDLVLGFIVVEGFFRNR
jgi:hypothetical protein